MFLIISNQLDVKMVKKIVQATQTYNNTQNKQITSKEE